MTPTTAAKLSVAKSGAGVDRAIRSLHNLENSASTARTFNLISVWRKHAELNPDYKARPFFRSPLLNRSIIVKHRLRPNERDLFPARRGGGTKVILPLDISDLRAGARSFFVGQVGYKAVLGDLLGKPGRYDRDTELLDVLDALPSLDPFLMRERLKTQGFTPARCYFDINEADTRRMFAFVRQELAPLVGLSFDDVDAQANEKTSALASKILAEAGDDELEPLRESLDLDQLAFEEGIFCWKGFLYYKWTLNALLPLVQPVSREIRSIKPAGPCDQNHRGFITAARGRLARTIAKACETVRQTLNVYDDAYRDLTRNGQPRAFREFLLTAPGLFYALGERLGAVQHIVSFWRYRFPEGVERSVSADELVDILADFEFSLSFSRS